MTIEKTHEDDGFMHHEGDFLILKGKIHVLGSVGLGFDPADIECEEYTTRCGLDTQSWGMPSQSVGAADFIPSLTSPQAENLRKCKDCFLSESEDLADIALWKLANSEKYDLNIERVSENKLNINDYPDLNPAEKGDRCIWKVQNVFDRDPKVKTHEVKEILFKKSDLKIAIDEAILTKKTTEIRAKMVEDVYFCEEANIYIRKSDPKVEDATITLKISEIEGNQYVEIGYRSEQGKTDVDKIVAEINESLPYPKSLSLDLAANIAVFNMASGSIDESGGGSVHDIDYYTFQAKPLHDLILQSLEPENKTSMIEVDAFRYTDYVDWPYGREDGSETHRENEPVKLLLGFKKREEMNVLVVAESNSEIAPQIDTDGFLTFLDLNDYRSKLKYSHQNMVYSFLNDPIFPNFGDLSDLDTPCELVFDNYYTPETSSDGDYSEERKRILYFDKAMVIEALAKLKCGRKVEVKGPGRAIHFLERAGYGYNHNENTVELNLDNPVEVTMSIELPLKNYSCIKLSFQSKPLNSSGGFSLSKSIVIKS